MQLRNTTPITIWLISMCFAIVFMIIIGGFTRLTHSGLSITEWNPISGIIPPLDQLSWEVEFNKYKQSPEYIQHNFLMSLSEFKFIYLLEFYHRIAGRLTTLLYCIPLTYFFISHSIDRKSISIYILGFILMICQGGVGWYMVKSGLISDPYVSHYRLAIHLMLAISLYIICFWQLIKIVSFPMLLLTTQSITIQKFLGRVSIALLLIQIMIGAFVAGLNAGLIYNSFPLMGDGIIPNEFYNSTMSIINFSDPIFIQFIHRIMAYILFIIIIIFCYTMLRLKVHSLSYSVLLIIVAMFIQLGSGIITLVYVVPISTALLHQLGAVLLLSCLLYSYYLLNNAK